MTIFRCWAALTLGAFPLLACSGRAVDVDAAITARGIQAHTSVLAHDSLEGRGTGQAGYRRAAEYVASEFRKMRLAPGAPDQTYFQHVPLREAWLDRAAVTVIRGGRRTALEAGTDFIAGGSVTDSVSAVEGPVVFVGYGVTAPAFQHDDYAGVDVRGKIVAVLRGAPASFPANPRAHYSGAEKARTAAARGAVGMVTLWTEEAERVRPWAVMRRFANRSGMAWLDTPGGEPGDAAGPAGSATLSPAQSAALFTGAPVSWSQALAAVEQGRARPVELPVRIGIERTTRHREIAEPNVIGVLRGSDPALRDEYVVFTAHLDHDGIGEPVNGDSIYNGAIDNATGVAALLEVARAFASGPAPRRSLIFIATAAEEKGLLGAGYFAAHPTVPIESIVANLNLDGNHVLFPTRSIIAMGAEHSTLAGAAGAAARATGLELETDLMPEQAFFIRSDQYPFVRKGVPALFFVNGSRSTDPAVDGGAALGRWLATVYHTPKDDLDQPADWEAGARYARVVYRVGQLVANEDARPGWNPGDFFGEAFGSRPPAAR